MVSTLPAIVSIFALLVPTLALPVEESDARTFLASLSTNETAIAGADTRTFLSSLKLNETAINLLKDLQGTQLACGALTSLMTDQTEAKGVSTYEKDCHAHWSPTAWETPTCIFSPKSTEDVQTAVKILTFTGSEYAIRSGGHSPLSSWANINNGILISMTKLKDISYDSTKQTVRFGMGNLWGDVYRYTEPLGRLPVGGRVGTVGPMLTPGGGLSHMSNRYGMSADNVDSFDLVLADGSTTTASASTNKDLFWALKGGSSNFGIITHMTLKTYPSGKVWGGLVVYNATLYQDHIMAAFATYQKEGQVSNKDTAMLTYVGMNNNTIFATYVAYGTTTRPEAFQPFFDIPTLADTTSEHDTFLGLTEANPVNFAVPRWTWEMTTIYLDNSTYVDAVNALKEFADETAKLQGGTFAVMPQPISTSLVDASKELGGNPMGMTSKAQLWFTVNVGWMNAADDERGYAIAKASIRRVEEITKERNLYDPFIFLNDAGPSQAVLQSYGSANFAKLKEASAKYDPTGMFQKQVPGGFKIV